MKITVRLRRNQVLRPSKTKPVIKGFVIGAGGAEGDNIVKPGIRDFAAAQASARDYLKETLGHLGPLEITFDVQEPAE